MKKLIFAKSRVKELAYKDFSGLLRIEIDKHHDRDFKDVQPSQISRFLVDLCLAKFEKTEIFKNVIEIFSQIKFEKDQWGYLIAVLKAHCNQ